MIGKAVQKFKNQVKGDGLIRACSTHEGRRGMNTG
jgi:hypothetical protein